MRSCGRVAHGVGVVSRFGEAPTGRNSCNSGRKPGLDLQRQIIEGVLIHDQSLIQEVLCNLEGNRGRMTTKNRVTDSLKHSHVPWLDALSYMASAGTAGSL